MAAWLRAMLYSLAPITLLACEAAGPPAGDELEGGNPRNPEPVVSATPSPMPWAEPGVILPDLATELPDELLLRNLQDGGREIRFNTNVLNVGSGVMHVEGTLGPGGETATANQIIERENDEPLEVEVGQLQFDRSHDHWHFDRFLVFEMWSIDENGEAGDLLAATDKISFCLIDHFPHRDDAPPPMFTTCEWQEQGITPGWTDRYNSALPGQQLDVSELEDGLYIMRMQLNPDQRLHEAEYGNNLAESLIELSSASVRLVP